jgi:serine phosphatase RsbU (regulator of sigma subunit)
MELYQQIFFTTLAVVFGILHLMLYLYNRQFRSNLIFSLFLFLYAVSIFFDFQRMVHVHSIYNSLFLGIHHAVMPYRSICGLVFIYSIFGIKRSRLFWVISMGLAVTGAIATLHFSYFNLLLIFVLAYMIEATRVLTGAILRKKDGAWIIASGFILLFLLSLYDMSLDFKLLRPLFRMTNGYQFGFGFLIISTSIYLARDYAKMNRTILEQERQSREAKIRQRVLEEEDARKSRELEEARELQLAMLPKRIAEIGGLDVCFEMKPATEVGGDYFDYLTDDKGFLTVAVGDATGHGMKAGLMVSIIKSLFITHALRMDSPDFFNLCSRTIRKMKLGNLYMTLLLMRIDGKKITVSSAGMPPFLIYRAGTKTTDEIALKGAPLGAAESFAYQTVEAELNAGDTVLLMSDGFPELFNERDEMLDYGRVKEIFTQAAEMPPGQIVRSLFQACDQWRESKKQADDITFVVLKSKAINQKLL